MGRASRDKEACLILPIPPLPEEYKSRPLDRERLSGFVGVSGLFTNVSASPLPSLDNARVNRVPIADICCEKERRGELLVSDGVAMTDLSSGFIRVWLNSEQE